LLCHDWRRAFVSGKRRDVCPPVGDSCRKQKASASTRLAQLVNPDVDHLAAEGFEARRQVMKQVQVLEVTILHLVNGLKINLFDRSACD